MALLPPDDEEVTMETREAKPANMLIKIESFSLLSKYGIREYESREFLAGDYVWRLKIYPDGHESTESAGDHISVYLSVTGTSDLPVDWEFNAICSIILYNQSLDKYLCFRGKTRRFHAMYSEWGVSKLISKKSLTDPSNGYLVDDKCVFGAEIFVIKSQQVIECVSVQKVRDPYKRDWRISQFCNLEGVWTSEVFPAGGLRWQIKLYPNGNGSEEGRSVSIIMECVDSKSFGPHEKVKAEFCMSFRSYHSPPGSRRSVNFSQWFSSSQPDWELLDFIPISQLRKDRCAYDSYCCSLETNISMQVIALDPPKSKNYVPSSKLKIEKI